MTISVQTVATVLTIFVALGIIFIGIRECFQPSVAARQFGVPLATPADRDFLAIKASRDIAPGVAVLAQALYQEPCVHVPRIQDPCVPNMDVVLSEIELGQRRHNTRRVADYSCVRVRSVKPAVLRHSGEEQKLDKGLIISHRVKN